MIIVSLILLVGAAPLRSHRLMWTRSLPGGEKIAPVRVHSYMTSPGAGTLAHPFHERKVTRSALHSICDVNCAVGGCTYRTLLPGPVTGWTTNWTLFGGGRRRPRPHYA